MKTGVRWLLVLPAAFSGYIVAFIILAVFSLVTRFIFPMGLMSIFGLFLFVFLFSIPPWLFVNFGTAVAPSRRKCVAISLLIIHTALLAAFIGTICIRLDHSPRTRTFFYVVGVFMFSISIMGLWSAREAIAEEAETQEDQ